MSPLLGLIKMTRLSELIRGESKHSLSIPHWFERLASIGIVTANPEIARRQRITNIGAYVAAGTTVAHLIVNAMHDTSGLIVIHIFNAIFALLAFLIPNLHRYGENAAAIGLATLVLVGTLVIVWLLGTASHLQIYFTLIGALLLFVGMQNWKLFSVYFALFTMALLLTLNYAPHDGLIMPQDKALRDMLTNQAMINTITVNCVIIFYAIAALRRAEVNLSNEYARSEALVTAMMPTSIATRLKTAPDQRIADRIECLSILFADLVGFTKAAHDLPPDQVVAYLDELVCAFDALCEQFGTDKIKTIGDCYMAVAGVDGDGPSGARAIGCLALEMLETPSRCRLLGGRSLQLRVGLHCGPATAGVIGDMRFSYDVWGDAVNVAARMESHGVPNRIHVSEAFRAMTQNVFIFEERGTTDIKSIGPSQTFFLVGDQEQASQHQLGAASVNNAKQT
jgi:adenylate cyclase